MNKMRKLKTVICALLTMSTVSAQNDNLVLLGTDVIEVEYQVTSMSPNGLWACGNINDGDSRAWRWDLTTGELTQLSAIGDFSVAMSISNDGTIAGSFSSEEATANGTPMNAAGYWRDGKWYYLSQNNYITANEKSGRADCISPDGKTFGGIAYQDGKFVPVIWNEKGEMSVYVNRQGGVYDITNDAKLVAGWTYGVVKNNRTPTLWTSPKDSLIIYYGSESPWGVASRISPDGTKVLAYDMIYDVPTGNKTYLNPYDKEGVWGFEFFDISNSGMVVGCISDFNNVMYGSIYKDGELLLATDYFKKFGVDLSAYHVLQVIAVSEDEKTFALEVYDSELIPRPMVVKLGVNTTTPAPVAVKATNMPGLKVNRIEWKAPLTNDEEGLFSRMTAYDVYRNNEKIASVGTDRNVYYDDNLSNGEYEYHVRAVYGTDESASSASSSTSVADWSVSATPRHLKAVHTGIADVRLLWEAPTNILPTLKYTNDTDDILSMGGGDISFENAVRYTKEDLACYAGQQIMDFTFYPMSVQNSWTVNFYYAGNPVAFYSEQIPTENLKYGAENTVRLKNPVNIPENTDLIVGLAVDVTGFGGYETTGIVFNKCKPGYTDLTRQAGEIMFYSLYDAARSSEGGAYDYSISWPLGIGIGTVSSASEVVSYKVYANGDQLGTSDKGVNAYRQNSVADGEYTYEVSAVLGDGKETPKANVTFKMTQNKQAYVGITDLNIKKNGSSATASWDVPVEDDMTIISYASDINTGGLVASEDVQYSYQAATDYDAHKLGVYDGYLITHLRFYPTADADFTFILKQGNEEVVYKELLRGEDYSLNQWNNIKLDEPVRVNSAYTYRLILDCYDVTPDKAPLGMDTQLGFTFVSDLYSTDDGESFRSTYMDGSKNANWMLGMVVRSEETRELPVKGYKVFVDYKTVVAEQSETAYTHTNFTDGDHNMRVDVLYENGTTGYGSMRFFSINAASIDELGTAPLDITLDEDGDCIRIEGASVSSVVAYSVQGLQVAASESNVLDIAKLNKGVYLIVAEIDGVKKSFKINLK